MLKQSCSGLRLGVLGAFGAAFLAACAPPSSSSSSLVAVAPAPPFIPSAQDRPAGLWAQAVWNIDIFPVWSAPAPPVLPGNTYGFNTVECTSEHPAGRSVFPRTMVPLSFFSPRYPSQKGGFIEDGRFVYNGDAPDSEVRAQMQRLEAIGAGTDIELVRAAVVLDRALLAVRLRDERLVADMAGEIERFLERTTLDKEDAEHWSSSGSYRYHVREELQRALNELSKIKAGSLLLHDPCGAVAVPTSAIP